MVVCRYFQQGCCRFGKSCRNEHIYGQKYTYVASYQDDSHDNTQFGRSNAQALNGNPFGGSEIFRHNQNNSAFGNSYGQNPFLNSGNHANNQPISNFPQHTQIQPRETISASALFAEANAKLQQNQVLPQNVFGHTNNYMTNVTNSNVINPFEASSPFTQTIPSNVFGNNPFNNNFGKLNAALQTDKSEGVYSNRENLSEQDVAAFESNTFQHGFIPEIAPSKELCY